MDTGAAPLPEHDAGERLSGQERRLRLLLSHLAGRAVRARVETDDLLQEVYLRVLAGPLGLPPWEAGEGALWRVLAQQARHTVIDVARALRAAKRDGRSASFSRSDWSSPHASRAFAASALRARGPGPYSVAAAGETSRILAARFLELPPDYRRVIGLRQFEGLSARDAAARLRRTESAVHSLYRRALSAWEEAVGRAEARRPPDDPPAADPSGARDESRGARRLDLP